MWANFVEMELRKGYLMSKIIFFVWQFFFHSQEMQECMHYHLGHLTIALCIYYSTFIENDQTSES